MEDAGRVRMDASTNAVRWAEELVLEAPSRHAPLTMASPVKSILKQRPKSFSYTEEPGKQLAWPSKKTVQLQRRCTSLVGSKRPRVAAWG